MMSIFRIVQKESDLTTKSIHAFEEALTRLRFEGKLRQPSNAREVMQFVDGFSKHVALHAKTEERVLFPFIQERIPRLEPLVSMLALEHQDFRRALRRLNSLLERIIENPETAGAAIDPVFREGTLLIFLLNAHLSTQSVFVYKTADRELRSFEKQALMRRFRHASLS